MSQAKTKSRGRGVLAAVLFGLIGVAFAGTLYFLYQKAAGEEPVVKTESPIVTEIVQKAVATGKIVPRQEVQIKPRVSGIVKQIFVEPGDVVEAGTLIAEIKIVPDMAALTRAESEVHAAQIALRHAKAELERTERLSGDGLSSQKALADRKLEFDLRKAELSAAGSQLAVVRDGATRQSDDSANTKVRSTVAGTVLEVPVEEGASVIESNTFNEGTTVATVADMGDMIFLGRVDEADVGKIKKDMEVLIKIGAVDAQTFPARLEYIAPKGIELEGAIQFEIKAALDRPDGVVIRAGYSANAEIVLERRKDALAISESLLQFEADQAFVEVASGPGQFERRDLEVGISDGIHIEILGGIDQDATIRVPEPDDAGPPG
jgi:HlyD family secretion protein